jgi:hypothetical protein
MYNTRTKQQNKNVKSPPSNRTFIYKQPRRKLSETFRNDELGTLISRRQFSMLGSSSEIPSSTCVGVCMKLKVAFKICQTNLYFIRNLFLKDEFVMCFKWNRTVYY